MQTERCVMPECEQCHANVVDSFFKTCPAQTRTMTRIWRNQESNLEVDPTNNRGKHENWIADIMDISGTIRYNYFDNLHPKTSEYLTRFILDMEAGTNLAKGVKKGKRSYVYLTGIRIRLRRMLFCMERHIGKEAECFSENDVLKFFTAMKEGQVSTVKGTRYKAPQHNIKIFCVYWRWFIRINHKIDVKIPDIVINLDTSSSAKPKWQYFTLKEAELMSENAQNLYYRTLILFLYDAGIRAPKELMNVRAMDITPVPNSNQLFLEIRDDTSKTFGRKIKLMICSDILRKYIETHKLKGEDFLFTKHYVIMHRVISMLGYKVLGRGHLNRQDDTSKALVRDGITMYDFRHNSVCHYLPIYKSENQMKYRYGWTKADMIAYYSEFMGMKDTITDADMITDSSKVGLQIELDKANQRAALMQEQMNAQKADFDERMKKIETMMLQKFADNF